MVSMPGGGRNAARDRRFWSAVAICLAGSDRLLKTP
jgi:hypothetical protein